MMARRRGPNQRGITMLVVLVLLVVVLLGSVGLGRSSEVRALAYGNVASREASVQASEVGVNTAFAALQALAVPNSDSGGWYWAAMQTADGSGVPTIDWDSAPELTVVRFRVRYAVERLCTAAMVTDEARQCLLRQDPKPKDRDPNNPQLEPPAIRQFRITVRVTEQRGTQTWVQALASKG